MRAKASLKGHLLGKAWFKRDRSLILCFHFIFRAIVRPGRRLGQLIVLIHPLSTQTAAYAIMFTRLKGTCSCPVYNMKRVTRQTRFNVHNTGRLFCHVAKDSRFLLKAVLPSPRTSRLWGFFTRHHLRHHPRHLVMTIKPQKHARVHLAWCFRKLYTFYSLRK